MERSLRIGFRARLGPEGRIIRIIVTDLVALLILILEAALL